MEHKKALDKIKKLLRLAASDNPHEAAAAMRQARALMEKHQLDQATVEMADIEEHSTRSGSKIKPARWEGALAITCARAYACRSLFTAGTGEWCFIGELAEVASYTMTVLLRQVRQARRNYIADKLKRCKTATKTKRADMFCEAWVGTVYRQVMEFADAIPSVAVEAYMQRHYSELEKASLRDRNAGASKSERSYNDRQAGRQAASSVRLNHGVNGQEQLALT